MDNLDVIQTLLRTALAGNRDAVIQQAERLQDRLQEQGDLEGLKAIKAIVSRARRTQKSDPLSLTMSNATANSLQQLGLRTPLPVDRESGIPLCEIVFPSQKDELPILEPITERAIDGLLEEWSHSDRLAASGLPASRSLLLFGPPGTGKTTLARHLANELRLPAVVVRIDGLISSLLGSTSRNLAALFDFSNRYETVLILDEFDAVAKVRDDPNEVGEIKRVVNALLQNLDRRAEVGVTIGITNHEQLLDTAIWRRFEHQISVGLPTFEIRKRIARRQMAPLGIPSSLARAIAWISTGLSGADVKTLSVSAMKAHVLSPDGTRPVELLRLALRGSGPRIGPGFGVLYEQDSLLAAQMSSSEEGEFGSAELGELFGKDRRTIARWLKGDNESEI